MRLQVVPLAHKMLDLRDYDSSEIMGSKLLPTFSKLQHLSTPDSSYLPHHCQIAPDKFQ